MMWRRLSSLRILAAFQPPVSASENTGLESRVNPPTGMSALHQKWKHSKFAL
jgi:hypothetical protein